MFYIGEDYNNDIIIISDFIICSLFTVGVYWHPAQAPGWKVICPRLLIRLPSTFNLPGHNDTQWQYLVNTGYTQKNGAVYMYIYI
jgi:hypothetical protein